MRILSKIRRIVQLCWHDSERMCRELSYSAENCAACGERNMCFLLLLIDNCTASEVDSLNSGTKPRGLNLNYNVYVFCDNIPSVRILAVVRPVK